MVLVVSDRAVLYALCLLWNKMQSCPAIKQLEDGDWRERGRTTVRVGVSHAEILHPMVLFELPDALYLKPSYNADTIRTECWKNGQKRL